MNPLRKHIDPALITSLHEQHHSGLSLRQCTLRSGYWHGTLLRRFAALSCPTCLAAYQRKISYERKAQLKRHHEAKAELARLHMRIRQLERQLASLAIAHGVPSID